MLALKVFCLCMSTLWLTRDLSRVHHPSCPVSAGTGSNLSATMLTISGINNGSFYRLPWISLFFVSVCICSGFDFIMLFYLWKVCKANMNCSLIVSHGCSWPVLKGHKVSRREFFPWAVGVKKLEPTNVGARCTSLSVQGSGITCVLHIIFMSRNLEHPPCHEK